MPPLRQRMLEDMVAGDDDDERNTQAGWVGRWRLFAGYPCYASPDWRLGSR
jgi:hypothetical protein